MNNDDPYLRVFGISSSDRCSDLDPAAVDAVFASGYLELEPRDNHDNVGPGVEPGSVPDVEPPDGRWNFWGEEPEPL